MEVSFRSLPFQLQLAVVKKMEFVELARFRIASRLSNKISQIPKNSFPLVPDEVYHHLDSYNYLNLRINGKLRFVSYKNLKHLPIRIEAPSMRLEGIDNSGWFWAKPPAGKIFISDFYATIWFGVLYNRPYHLPNFCALVGKLNAKTVQLDAPDTPFTGLDKPNVFSKVDFFHIDGTLTPDLLLSIQVKELNVFGFHPDITAKVLNTYLKDPLTQVLRISNQKCRFFAEDQDHVLLEGLSFVQIWNSKTHIESPLSHIRLQWKSGRAYTVSNFEKNLLVVFGIRQFYMVCLKSKTEVDIRRESFKLLCEYVENDGNVR